jgi:hypothetical protein
MRQAETLNVFQARLALLLSSKLSLRCGGAVVPVMILQTTQMRALAVGVAWHRLFTSRVSMSESLTKKRLLGHGAEMAIEAIRIHGPHFLIH